MQPIALPHGPPVDVPMNERPIHTSVDIENDSLRLKRECFPCGFEIIEFFPYNSNTLHTSFLRRETTKNIRTT